MMHFFDGHLHKVVLGCWCSCGKVCCHHTADGSGQCAQKLMMPSNLRKQRMHGGSFQPQEELQGEARHAICMILCRHLSAACLMSLKRRPAPLAAAAKPLPNPAKLPPCLTAAAWALPHPAMLPACPLPGSSNLAPVTPCHAATHQQPAPHLFSMATTWSSHPQTSRLWLSICMKMSSFLYREATMWRARVGPSACRAGCKE